METRHPVALGALLREAQVEPTEVRGSPETMVASVHTHAQTTSRNGVFVAIAGTRTDSHALVEEAVNRGAAALVVQRPIKDFPGVAVVRVPNTRRVVGPMAHALEGHPSRAMNVCGITGTNGKTTTTHFVYTIMREAGHRPGLIGTLGSIHGDRHLEGTTTTPGPLELAEIFREFERGGVDTVAMECSSHAIDQHRIAGIGFRCGALLGITQDHLDYHGTFANYVAAKQRLFTDFVGPTPGSVAVFNLDDPHARQIASVYTRDKLTFSRFPERGADVTGTEIRLGPGGTSLTLRIDGRRLAVEAPILGDFNVTNMLAAATCAHVLGADADRIAEGLAKVSPVRGRFEFVDEGQPFTVLVDYAHTPDALRRVLHAARRICASRLIVVFGCGGDRDRGKRPLMGQAVGELADFAIVTDDNPRTEDPAAIHRGIVEGILQSALKTNRYRVIGDRRAAIEKALGLAMPGDVVLLAGKGQETYQEAGTERHPFDDREVARGVLRRIVHHFNTSSRLEPTTEQLP